MTSAKRSTVRSERSRMEYNPMEELGLTEEKQLIMSCDGIISSNDYARDLCARSIRNGARFFDVISRYEDLTTYALEREEGKSRQTMKMIVPFLKAFGMTDHFAYEFAKETFNPMPGAGNTLAYLRRLLPTFIATGSFEHHVMAMCDALDFPIENVTCTRAEFDSVENDRMEDRKLREIANRISSLRLPKTMYTVTESDFLDEDDAKMVTELDDIFDNEVPKMEAWKAYKDLLAIGSNEKAYALLEIRRKTEIEFNSTAYIGSGINDFQALDLIRDSEGLAISYNGSEYAVRGCNIAVMSNDTIVLDVLIGEFYNEGIQAVYDMVDNWNIDYLQDCKCSDRNLMNRMLDMFPRKLPVVKKVGRRNVKSVIEESDAYRRKLKR